MSYLSKQNIFLKNIALLILKIQDLGFEISGGELERSKELQLIYYHGKKIVEKNDNIYLTDSEVRSKTMNSKHLVRRAIDINFFKDGKYLNTLRRHELKKILQPVGDYWESLDKNNNWGGNWNNFFDAPHFEMK